MMRNLSAARTPCGSAIWLVPYLMMGITLAAIRTAARQELTRVDFQGKRTAHMEL